MTLTEQLCKYPRAGQAWELIQGSMRRHLTASEHDLWVKPAKLLRVLEGPHWMFIRIPEHFEARRGGNTLTTILDFALLQTWADAGIPVQHVFEGIEQMFDRDHHAPCPRGINSIAYCSSAVLREAERAKEANVGNSEQGTGYRDETAVTLLIGLPRNGKAIFRARIWKAVLQDEAAKVHPLIRIALTVQPDEWQASQVDPSFLQQFIPKRSEGSL